MSAVSESGGGRSSSAEPSGLWVFGYGSLVWRPGFVFDERQRATVVGWTRRLCVYSHIYRGTVDRPGLVFGLDRGGLCAGVAFHVGASDRAATLNYLRERELVTDVYLEQWVTATLEDSRNVSALAYVADPKHVQYAGTIDEEALLDFVRNGVGQSGSNIEYVLNTRDHLREIGIVDQELEWLSKRLQPT